VQLLVQVAGAFAAGLLVWMVGRSVGLRGRPAAAAVAVVAMVAGALLSAPAMRNAIVSLTDQRHADEMLTDDQKRIAAGALLEPNEGFLAWTQERIAPGEDFLLITPLSPRGELNVQWATYRLEPRVQVAAATPGDWVVFYDVAASRYGAAFSEVEIYEPGFAIARYKRGA
jgi:hypothetical protein